MAGASHERVQGREGAADHDVGHAGELGTDVLDPAGVHGGPMQREFAHTLTQKRRLLADRLDQMNGPFRSGDRQNDPRESGTASDIDDRPGGADRLCRTVSSAARQSRTWALTMASGSRTAVRLKTLPQRSRFAT